MKRPETPPREAPQGTGVERVRGIEPDASGETDEGLRASTHSRLLDDIRIPVGDVDPDRARRLCAQVTRDLLGDLAPALLLLEPPERKRLQALLAYSRTLLDFALDASLHGERLAWINRWEFTLEQALEGYDTPSQPVFVAMAEADRLEPWDRDSLDSLAAAARTVAVTSDLEASLPLLATAHLRILTGEAPSTTTTEAVRRIARFWLRARGATHDDRSPDPAHRATDLTGDSLASARTWRRFLGFLVAATRRADRTGRASLGLGARITLLVRAGLTF